MDPEVINADQVYFAESAVSWGSGVTLSRENHTLIGSGSVTYRLLCGSNRGLNYQLYLFSKSGGRVHFKIDPDNMIEQSTDLLANQWVWVADLGTHSDKTLDIILIFYSTVQLYQVYVNTTGSSPSSTTPVYLLQCPSFELSPFVTVREGGVCSGATLLTPCRVECIPGYRRHWDSDFDFYCQWTGEWKQPYRPPKCVPQVVVMGTTPGSVTLAWNAAPVAAQFSVFYQLAGNSFWSTPVAGGPTGGTVTGLVMSEYYRFQVNMSCDANYSPVSSRSVYASPTGE